MIIRHSRLKRRIEMQKKLRKIYICDYFHHFSKAFTIRAFSRNVNRITFAFPPFSGIIPDCFKGNKMEIEAFLLCDAATDQQGKLNVLGAFDNLWVRQLPAKHPQCSIAARVRFERIEEGDHAVKIQIIDEDGQNIAPKLEGTISVRTAPGIDSSATNLILNIQGLEFKRFGSYQIDLAIDGQLQASLPLRVTEAPKQPDFPRPM
jgi:hypothetical protein